MTEQSNMSFASLTTEMPYFVVVLSAFVDMCSSSKELYFDVPLSFILTTNDRYNVFA